MNAHRKLAFIGAGQMAGALIKGLIKSGAWRPDAIVASDVSKERLETLERSLGIRITTSNAEAVTGADLVILSTKPQAFDRVLPEIAGVLGSAALILSVAAGVSTAVLEAQLPANTRVVRVMPNTPALIGQGATAIAAGRHAHSEDLTLAEQIFQSVGITTRLDETLLDAVTGLSGSGPAYVFLFIEALAEAGVKAGVPRTEAMQLAVQTLVGSALLAQQSDEHPARLKDMVTSPAGTTATGLHVLETAAFRAAIIEAVEAAANRSRELGAQLAARLSKTQP